MLKRKASRAPSFQPPTKLNKRSTSATIDRQAVLSPAPCPRQSALPTTATPHKPHPVPSPRPRSVTPSRRTPSLPLPKWPTLVPTNRPARKVESKEDTAPVQLSAASDVSEVSEEQTIVTPGLRRLSTLPLDDGDGGACTPKAPPTIPAVKKARSSSAGKKGRSGVQLKEAGSSPTTPASLTKSTSQNKSKSSTKSASLIESTPDIKVGASAAKGRKGRVAAAKGKTTAGRGKVKVTAGKGTVKILKAKAKTAAMKAKGKDVKTVKKKQPNKGRKPNKAVKGKKAAAVKNSKK